MRHLSFTSNVPTATNPEARGLGLDIEGYGFVDARAFEEHSIGAASFCVGPDRADPTPLFSQKRGEVT